MGNSFITRGITSDGSARLIYADTTAIVQKAQELHNTSKTMTAALGRILTGASIMGSLQKDKTDSLTLMFKGDGPAGAVVCVADYKGNVKGYAQDHTIELPPNAQGKLDVSGAIGKTGTMYVLRDISVDGEKREPYTAMAPIISGEIAEDITNFYVQSEQIPTVCALGVRCNTENKCTAAGGILLQLLPGADEAIIEKLESNLAMFSSISAIIAGENPVQTAFDTVFKGIEYEMFDEFDIDYVCDCSRERYLTALVGLPKEDRDELLSSKEKIETVCHFCESKYHFDPDEIPE